MPVAAVSPVAEAAVVGEVVADRLPGISLPGIAYGRKSLFNSGMKTLLPINVFVFSLAALLNTVVVQAQPETQAPETLMEGAPEDFAGLIDPVRVVPILQEPRHRTMHRLVTEEDAEVRLLDVQINPGDMTLPHTHDAAILYTFISNGEGPLNGRLSSVTRYVDENYTHRVSNPGPGLFQIIALTSYAEPVRAEEAEGDSALPTGLAQAPDINNGWFRAWRLTLAPGEARGIIQHQHPAFVVQASAGDVQLLRSDGITEELQAAGHWSALSDGQQYTLVNRSEQVIAIVIKEARVTLSD